MRHIALAVCMLFSFACGTYAQDDLYIDAIDGLLQETAALETALSQKTINYQHYDQWYSGFKARAEAFRKDLAQAHKQKDSYRFTQNALDGFSLAWTAFKQAEYAAAQYQDFITSGDVGYAHKWKEQAAGARKDALEKINEACLTLKKAKVSAQDGR